MKRNDIKKLHDLELADLNVKLKEMSEQLAKARLDKHVGKLAHKRLVSVLAHDLARVKTIITEKSTEVKL